MTIALVVSLIAAILGWAFNVHLYKEDLRLQQEDAGYLRNEVRRGDEYRDELHKELEAMNETVKDLSAVIQATPKPDRGPLEAYAILVDNTLSFILAMGLLFGSYTDRDAQAVFTIEMLLHNAGILTPEAQAQVDTALAYLMENRAEISARVGQDSMPLLYGAVPVETWGV